MKNYNDFNYQLNEGFISNIVRRIIEFFLKIFGKKAFGYIALYLNNKGKIPKVNGVPKVIIRTPNSWKNNKNVVDVENEFGEIKTESVEYESELENQTFNIIAISKDYVYLNEDVKYKRSDVLNEYATTYRRSDYDPSDYINIDSEKLQNLDVSQLKSKIKTFYKMAMDGDRLSLFIWGAPGIGKTSVTQQISEELNLMLQVWTLATLEAADLKGIPTLRELTPDPNMPEVLRKKLIEDLKKNNFDFTETINALPMILPQDDWNTNNYNGGILFFDELNRAIPDVLDASLRLTLEGKMDEYELPKSWLVIAAGNRVSDIQGGNIRELEPAILNRFAHINFAPKFEDWVDYVKDKPYMNSDIIDFLKSDNNEDRPEFYYKLMSNFAKVNENPAAPTPRSWENAARKHFAAANFDENSFVNLVKNWDGIGNIPGGMVKKDWDWENKYNIDKDILYGIYKGSVGHEAASHFVDFHYAKKAEIEEMKRNEMKKKSEKPKTKREEIGIEEKNNIKI